MLKSKNNIYNHNKQIIKPILAAARPRLAGRPDELPDPEEVRAADPCGAHGPELSGRHHALHSAAPAGRAQAAGDPGRTHRGGQRALHQKHSDVQ